MEQIPTHLFREVVDSTPNPVMIFETCGLNRYANQAAHALFGDFETIFDLVENPKSKAELQRQLYACEEGALQDFPPAMEIEIHCLDQQRHFFEVKWRRINDDSNFLVAVFRNVDTEKKRQQELHRQAVTDFLSGLPNRRQFRAILDSQTGQDVCLAILDVDNFKQINDQLGHPTGDSVIRFVARKLMEHFDDALCVARLGGDEFCVLIRKSLTNEATQYFESFRKSIEESKLTEIERDISISIGIANSFPDWNWRELLTRADQALYRAKENGRNQVVAFSDQWAVGRKLG